MLIYIAFVSGLVCAVTNYAFLIGDKEEIVVLLVIESSVDRVRYYLADRPRRESCKFSGVVRIRAVELALLEIDSVLLEDVADRYVRSERHALIKSVHEYSGDSCLIFRSSFLRDYRGKCQQLVHREARCFDRVAALCKHFVHPVEAHLSEALDV